MDRRIIHIFTPAIVAILFVAIAIGVLINGVEPTTYHYTGMIESAGVPITIDGVLPILGNIFTIILIALLWSRIAAQFGLTKEHTLLPIAFILLFQSLNPSLAGNIAVENIITLIIGVIFFILYTCYQQKLAIERSFIIGLIFALTALFYARVIYFLPIFLLGMFQMQAGSPRTLAATIVGLITPYWIIWGMGWVDASQFTLSNLAISLQMPALTWQIIPAASVLLLGLFAGTANLINNYNENIKTRAMNGFVNILSAYTALLMIIDNAHYTTYLPILNCVVTLQLCYLFTSQHNRTYNILFFTLTALLLGGIVWIYWV